MYVHRDVAGVAVDGEDRVYLICRGDHPVMVYDQKGKFLRSWGEGDFTYRTHGIYVGPNGTIFCTDDGNHTVRQFTPEGRLLMTLGVMNTPSDTGYDGKSLDSIKRGVGPVQPSDQRRGRSQRRSLCLRRLWQRSRSQFSPTGQLKRSWGGPAEDPASSICRTASRLRPDGRVFVCDRESDRIQIFSPDGEVPERVDGHPAADPPRLRFQGRAYVTELGGTKGHFLHAGPDQERTPCPLQHLRQRRSSAVALGHAGRVRTRKLRRAAWSRGRFEERCLRERGHLDLRSQPRPSPCRLSHVSEVFAEAVN